MTNDIQKPRILLVEDDTELANLTKSYLCKNGYELEIIDNGEQAISAILTSQPDLLILDVMLPGKDGMDICREIRHQFFNPILMLTAKSDNIDQILGLEMGADDYVCKPVEPRLLLARVKALLRRPKQIEPGNKESNILNFGNLNIDKSTRELTVDGQNVELTAQEFEMIWYLASHAGQVLSRDQLFLQVRGFEYDGISRFVDVTISHLRTKIRDDADKPKRIRTIFGKGYMFVGSELLG